MYRNSFLYELYHLLFVETQNVTQFMVSFGKYPQCSQKHVCSAAVGQRSS